MMMFLNVLYWIVFFPTAFSVGYVVFFVCAARIRSPKAVSTDYTSLQPNRFLLLFPAYAEDGVILQSVRSALAIDYPKDLFHVAVISDHMQDATNEILASLPITFLKATYEDSTKAKALQLAMREVCFPSDYVIILDADNVVESDFLKRLNAYLPSCTQSTIAIQCHRTAKNTNTDTALLDAVSEEINNCIFRLGHRAVGLSSALIGSGMCFSREWFAHHVDLIQTAGEDKELERLLLAERIKIQYLSDVNVYDEKVQNQANFSRQRLRWLSAQLYSARDMIHQMEWTFDYVDKFIQQCLIPRSMLLAIVTLMAFVAHDIPWLVLLALLYVSLFLAIPSNLLGIHLAKALLQVPSHTLSFATSLFRIKGQRMKFHHTIHNT